MTRRLRVVEFIARGVSISGVIWILHQYGIPACVVALLSSQAAYVVGAIGAHS